ncbi:MAG: hypothetical protein Q9199_004292 [Rusavskia elegans]
MTSTTLKLLQEIAEVHGITKLRIDNWAETDSNLDDPILPGLESFTTKSINLEVDYLRNLILEHYDTLKSLCLGAESDVLRDYQESNQNSLLRRQEYGDLLVDSLQPYETIEGASPWLMLRELQLVGLDVCKTIKPASLFLDLHSLTSLTLETCLGLETALDILTTEKDESGLPLRSGLRLHYFSLRHEASNQQFRARLIDFLSAIQGLTHLFVLLENSDRSRPNDLDPVLAVHGQSLRSLVWDKRSGKRDLFIPSEATYKASHLRLATIATHCPNLVELGISMDWRDFTKKGSHDPHSSNRYVCGLPDTLDLKLIPY